MSDDLKSCPFCGGKARYRTGCGVECSDCFANIVEARRLRDSVCAEWNRRTDATALAEAQAEIARLKDGLKEALDWNWLDDDAPEDVRERLWALTQDAALLTKPAAPSA